MSLGHRPQLFALVSLGDVERPPSAGRALVAGWSVPNSRSTSMQFYSLAISWPRSAILWSNAPRLRAFAGLTQGASDLSFLTSGIHQGFIP